MHSWKLIFSAFCCLQQLWFLREKVSPQFKLLSNSTQVCGGFPGSGLEIADTEHKMAISVTKAEIPQPDPCGKPQLRLINPYPNQPRKTLTLQAASELPEAGNAGTSYKDWLRTTAKFDDILSNSPCQPWYDLGIPKGLRTSSLCCSPGQWDVKGRVVPDQGDRSPSLTASPAPSLHGHLPFGKAELEQRKTWKTTNMWSGPKSFHWWKIHLLPEKTVQKHWNTVEVIGRKGTFKSRRDRQEGGFS